MMRVTELGIQLSGDDRGNSMRDSSVCSDVYVGIEEHMYVNYNIPREVHLKSCPKVLTSPTGRT